MRLLALLSVLIVAPSVFASNKDAPDGLIPPPPMPRNAVAQLFLGSIEVTAASVLLTRLDTSEVRAIKKDLGAAQDKLSLTKTSLTKAEAEAELQKLIEIQQSSVGLEERAIIAKQIERLEAQLKTGTFITIEERAAQVAALETQIAELRGRVLSAGKGFLKKGLKGLKIVGGALLILDVTGRVYIWTALERDPHVSPLVSIIRNGVYYVEWGAEPPAPAQR